jgi:hypothetical protein
MGFLLRLFATTPTNFTEFHGTWTDSVVPAHNSTPSDSGSFKVRLNYPPQLIYYPPVLNAALLIQGTSNFHFREFWIDLTLKSLSNNTYWLYSTLFDDAWFEPAPKDGDDSPSERLRYSRSLAALLREADCADESCLPSFSEFHARLQAELARYSVSFTSLGFQVFNQTNAEPFGLPFGIRGSLTYDGHPFALDGYQIDYDAFVGETKTFGVLLTFALLLDLLAWCSLRISYCRFTVRTTPVSLVSLLWHMAVDFGLLVKLHEFAEELTQLRELFSYLAWGFWLMGMIGMTIAAPEHHRGFIPMLCGIARFLLQLIPFLWAMHVAWRHVFESPVLCSIVLFSAFVPQIWANAKRWRKRNWDDWFSVLLGASRLLLVAYFCFREANVKEVKSAGLGFGLGLYLVAQVGIILLQNHCSGVSVLTTRFATPPPGYVRLAGSGSQCSICLDDMAPPLVAGAEVVGTPCGHVFHKECLTEWTSRKLICPICRADLPPDW